MVIESDASPVSLLLVEDELAHAFLIKSALEPLNLLAIHASSMGQAEEEIQRKIPALILSDLNLGDARGVETVERLHRCAPKVPIIVLTASTLLRDAVEAMRAGAEDFVVKSFDEHFAEVLRLSVLRSIERARARMLAARLEREQQCLQRAIEYGSDGLAVLGRDGDCHYKNSSFDSFAERCGLNTSNILDSSRLKVKNQVSVLEQLQEGLTRTAHHGVINLEIEPIDGQDEAYMVSISVARLASDDLRSGTDGLLTDGLLSDDGLVRIAWVRDISELKRRESFQRDTLSATTHDLKGPLGAISLSVELLHRITDPKKQEEIRVRIGALAKSCQTLIDEFLSASSIRAGALIVKREPTDVALLLDEVIRGMMPVAEAKKISLMAESVEDGCEWPLDRLAFVRILNNLISNGIKYSNSGGAVIVSARILSDDMLQFRVKDNGKGVDPGRVARIFEPYARLARDARQEGHGLGLFVTKSLVSAHGGTISVESILGVGSTFTVTIPRA
jgi:signal transduction histidine kinase